MCSSLSLEDSDDVGGEMERGFDEKGNKSLLVDDEREVLRVCGSKNVSL